MERRPGEGRSRGLVLLLLAVLVLVVGLGILFLARALSDGVKSGGPLARPAECRDAVAVPVDLKAPYWWGLIYLRNKGDEPAQVEALDLGQIPAGMPVLVSYAPKPGTGPAGFGERLSSEPGSGSRGSYHYLRRCLRGCCRPGGDDEGAARDPGCPRPLRK